MFILAFMRHHTWPSPMGKIARKNSPEECIFDNMAQKRTPSDCFFGDFAHWVVFRLIREYGISQRKIYI